MELYLKTKNGASAIGNYNNKTKEITVLKGSIVSEKISTSPKFRASKTIRKQRKKYVKENTVIENVKFNSVSTAANFITGTSCNGLLYWKDNNGNNLKKINIKENDNE